MLSGVKLNGRLPKSITDKTLEETAVIFANAETKAETNKAFLNSMGFYILIAFVLIVITLLVIFLSPSTKPSAMNWLNTCNNLSGMPTYLHLLFH